METVKGKTSEIKFLASIIHESTTLRGKMAILTYQNLTHSSIADRIVIFYEHYQTVILFVFSNYLVFTKRNTVSANVIDVVFPTIFSSSPVNFLQQTKEGTAANIIVCCFGAAFFVFKMLVFGYMMICASRNWPPSKHIQHIWQWIFKLQPRILYYLMAPIYATVAESTFKHLLDLSNSANMALRMVCILLFASEFTFSLVLQTQFTCILPIKSFLASKNNITQILTLLMKFCNHLVRKVLTFAPLVAVWIVDINSLLLGSLRLYLYFKYLPAYNIDCLFYEMYFLVIVLALNISCVLQIVTGENIIDMNLLVGIWTILSLFLVKISISYLKRKLLSLMMLKENKETSPQILIHKIMTIKYFLKKGIVADDQVTDYSWESLVKSSLTTNCITTNVKEHSSFQLDNKESRNKLFSLYLEELLARFPKNNFVRLYAAYHFSNKQRLYSKCLITIHKLKQSNSWTIDASLSVLFHGIKEKIWLEAHNKTFLFDVSEYALSTSSLAKARLEIMDQLEGQMNFYQEMKETCPSLDKLNQLGYKIIQKKREIEKNRKRLFQVIPEYYLEPLLLYAHYELAMNHSHERFSEYHERYSKRYQKYAKTFISDHFCQENFYKKNTIFLILSGEKGTQGKVLHCGGDYKQVLGRNITGQYMAATVPTVTMTDPKSLFNFILENGEKTILNRLQKRHFWNNQDGVMTEVEYFFNISPFISQGLIYYVIFRPSKNFQECILVNKEGGIESFTRGIGEQLNLFSLYKLSSNEEKNIGRICPELQIANEAFNMIGNKNHGLKGLISSLEEAKEICANYTKNENNQILSLERINHQDLEENRFTYRCTRIVPLSNNIHGAKEIYLERVLEKNSKETLGDISKKAKTEKIDHHITESDDDLAVDEKEAGWINLEKLQTDYNHPTLQSPVSSARHHLLTTRSPRNANNKFTLQTEEREVQKPTATQDSNSFAGVLSHHESVFSLKSEYKSRNKMKKQRAFEQAVNTPYDSPRCRIMTLLLFLLLLATFAIQLSSNIRIRQGFSDFGLNKDIVLFAESRNYYAANLNLVLSFYYGEVTQFFNISDVIPQANAMIFMYYISGAADQLRDANLNLSRFAISVSDAQRDILFNNNVKLYDIDYAVNSADDDSSHRFSSFQAINQVIETALKIKSLVAVDLSQTFPYLKFCLENILNDIWVKGNVIVENFYQHLQDNKDDFLQSLTLTFIGIILVPTLGLFAVCGFIFAQYNTDRNNLLALTKINKNSVDALSSNLTNFKSFLEQNSSFEKLLKEEKTLRLFENAAKYEKNQQPLSDARSINSGKFIKDYIILILKVLLMLVFLTVSFSIYFAIFSRNLRQMGEKAYQLYFLEKAASRVILLRGGFFNMVLTNNTELLTNRDGNVVLAEQIEKLQDVQNQFQDVFSTDTSGNEIVQDMLFNDVCKYFHQYPSTYSDCKKLGNYQEKLSWLNLMSNTRQKYQEYLAKYDASDKTNESLKELLADFIGNWMQTSVIVTLAVNNILIDAIDGEFTDMNNRSNALNNRMIIIYIFVVGFAGLIGFWGVLRPIRAKENKFKKFLLLFPANTILSNFILKSFLMKISKSSFDSIMHEM